MWRLFRRRPKGWIAISDYYEFRHRELTRNPGRLEEDQAQARKWSLRTAEKRLKEVRADCHEKET